MLAIYSESSCNFPQPRQAEAFTQHRSHNIVRAIAVIWTGPPTKRGPAPSGAIFVLGSFFSYSFLSFFALSDIGEQHDPGRSLGRSILIEGRLERQFSVSDLG